MNKSAETRRLYFWEENWIPNGPDTSIKELRTLGHRIWHEQGRKSAPPEIVAGKGSPNRPGGRELSYAVGKRIVLCRAQRRPRTLIHEMAHTLLPERVDHGPEFLNLYQELLGRYL